MGKYVVDVSVPTSASVAAVWEALTDLEGWAQWGPFDEAVLERSGAAEAHGVGSIRRLRLGNTVSRERIIAFEPQRRLAYELLSGIPVDDYVADVTVRPTSFGSMIRWRSSFDRRFPVPGAYARRRLHRFITELATQVARHAETTSLLREATA